MTNISDQDFKGTWDGKEIIIKEGETKLYPEFLADKFAEIIATKILNQLKKEIICKDELQEMKDKMIGSEKVEVELPEKTPTDILLEEIEYANKYYLNK